jgi:hypothetical protein
MREARNPFYLRRSETIETDTAFLTLFEPGILEVLGEQGLPETVRPIRSAAGGGKTSLLRLFTPSVLRLLHARRSDVVVKELYGRLLTLGAIDSQGPALLGVLLQCGRNYAVLQTMSLDEAVRVRLFFGLLNARIILGVLRNSLALRGLRFPEDLARVSLGSVAEVAGLPPGFPEPRTGERLYDWASALEAKISAGLDSFGPLRATTLPGHDSIFALGLIRPDSLHIDGQPVAGRVVLMMDDIQMLSAGQRSLLIQSVIEARSRVGIWIAERFEALSTEDMLASGSAEGRDHDAPLELEGFWRRRYQTFERHVMRLADRRVHASTESEMETFRSCLEGSLDGSEYEPTFRRAAEEVSRRVTERVAGNVLFSQWVASRRATQGSPQEIALGWRALEILIERELARPQKGLFDDIIPLDEEELEKKDDSSVKHAAELFLAREYDLPYYYGTERIARLASLNIQQFLGLAGPPFEEVLAAELLSRGPKVLSPRRQHALMKKAAAAVWNDIPKNVHHGRDLRAFLDSLGKFSHWYTYRSTAPNDPGVSGTAIRMSERAALMDQADLKWRPPRQRFADLLASALAHNFLVADLDYKCKGERWMVLNLNRLLCVQFDLPLGYGLYKERPLDELCRWVTEPFTPPRRQEPLYEQ